MCLIKLHQKCSYSWVALSRRAAPIQKGLRLLLVNHLHLPSFCVTVSEDKVKAMVVSPRYFKASVNPHFVESWDQLGGTVVSLTQCHPGSLLTRPVARPGWPPSPGRCRCGRAAACSHLAARERVCYAQPAPGMGICTGKSHQVALMCFLKSSIILKFGS